MRREDKQETKPFVAKNWGDGQVIIMRTPCHRMLPVEVHIKENGDLNDNPTMTIVMTTGGVISVFGEISLKMFNDALADIRYEMKKINT